MKQMMLTKCLVAALFMSGFVTTVFAALSPQEKDDILFIKQDEKLARDVYLYLGDKWGHPTFQNIAVSEQKHMDAVDGLIEFYGLSALDTTIGDEPGVFDNPYFANLYADRTGSGEASMEDVLYVGVAIEELDIIDLKEAIQDTDEKRIDRVFGNLLSGSNSHLDAFNKALAALE